MARLQALLQQDFAERRLRNERFSLRAYAKFLGINATSLSLFLSGKRGLAAATQKRVVAKVSRLSDEHRRQLYNQLQVATGATPFTEIDLTKMAVIGDWYYFAILSLLETEIPTRSPVELEKWMSDRLGLKLSVVRNALTNLLKLEMLRATKGGYELTGKNFSTPDQVAHLGIRRSHYQALELAKLSLDRDPVERRSFSAITLALDPRDVAMAHGRIQKFADSLCRRLEAGAKKEVYRMSFQLFPLTRPENFSRLEPL